MEYFSFFKKKKGKKSSRNYTKKIKLFAEYP